jgi:DNA-binding MarR family transcriptional regulator
MAHEPRDPIDEAYRQWVAHGWTDAAPGMAAVTTIVRVHQLLMGRIDAALRPYRLTFARYEVLRLLAFTRAGGLPMGRLGTLLQVHPASVTNAVARLETDGLVRRVPNPRDSRSTLAEILPQGRTLVEPATRDLNRLFASIGETDRLDRTRALVADIGRRCEDGTVTGG